MSRSHRSGIGDTSFQLRKRLVGLAERPVDQGDR